MGVKIKYHGLGVLSRVHDNGVEVFFIQYRYQHRQVRERIGTSLEDARFQRLVVKRAIKNGTYVPPEKRVQERPVTFKQFAEQFLRDYASQRRSNHYSGVVERLLRHLGDLTLRAIRPGDIERYKSRRAAEFQERYGRKIGDSTLRKELISLRTMFRVAKRWGMVDSNPAEDVPMPREPKSKTAYLEEDEVRRVLEELSPQYRRMAILFLQTGMRRGDLLHLRWDDVDFKRGIIWIGGRKTGEGYAVPMTEPARQALQEARETVRAIQRETSPARIIPWVFVDATGEDYISEERGHVVSRAMQRAMERAGVTKGKPCHIWRHTTASRLAQAQRSLYEIQKVLGHSSAETTQRYAHLLPDHLRDAAAVLAAAVPKVGEVASEVAQGERKRTR